MFHKPDFFKKYRINIIILFFLLVVVLLLTLKVKGVFYIYLFSLGAISAFLITKKTASVSLVELLITALFWGSGIIILISALFALLSIPIRAYVLYTPLIFLIPLLCLKPMDFSTIRMKPDRWEISLYVLALVSIVSHVISIADFQTPMLHDPITHASRAKEIYNTGLINYFYSPGLHILSALGMMADGVNVAGYVLILTNLFGAFGFIPVFFYVKNVFQNQWFAITSALIFLIAPFPADFFWKSGKNALVIAIPFMFFMLYIASKDISPRLKFLVINALTFILILIHYPTAAIGLIGLFFILLVKDGIRGLGNISVGLGLGLVWGLIKMRFEVSTMQGDVVSVNSPLGITLNSVGQFFKSMYPHVASQYQFPLHDIFFFAGLSGLLLMLIIAFKDKKYLSIAGFFAGYLLLMFLIKSTALVSFLYVVYESQLLTFFIFIYIGVAFILGRLIFSALVKWNKNISYALILIVLAFVMFRNYQIFTKYRTEQAAKDMVSESDLKAFEWISNNLGMSDIILNNAQKNNKQIFVFASDGGAWIPVFTDRRIAMPFTEFTAKNTHENYDVYTRIRDDAYNCSDIEKLLDKGIKYYYRDSEPVYGPQIDVAEDELQFKLIKSFDSAKIYEIIPCDQ